MVLLLNQLAAMLNGEALPPPPSVEQMAGQMLLIGFSGRSASDPMPQALARQIRLGHVGGVIMLGNNFKSREDVIGLTGLFREAAGQGTLLMVIDQEGGLVQRLGAKLGYESVPSATETGLTMTPEEARPGFEKLARTAHEAGFNVNLGPVVDLGRDSQNKGLGAAERTYSSNPSVVSAYATVFMEAQRANGMLPVLKHFPGHGSSRADTHNGIADITESWIPAELEPFQRLASDKSAPGVMTGHLLHARIASDGYPVSLSKAAITGFLRQQLGFDGVVISDDLQMTAVTNNYPLEQSVVLAINAGVDVLMICHSKDPELPGKIVAHICASVKSGKIERSTIEAAWKRIQMVKTTLGH